MLDVLACPECRGHPLKLYAFVEVEIKVDRGVVRKLIDQYGSRGLICSLYCGYKRSLVDSLDESIDLCIVCLSRDVKYGILQCGRCGRWFPIIAGIPIMYPDHIRLRSRRAQALERVFLKRFRERIPYGALDGESTDRLENRKEDSVGR